MTASPIRTEFTNIAVAPDGKWYTGPRQIVNEDVIKYFRENLGRDAQGVYIFHKFRELAEKGYITVQGPVDAVFRVEENQFLLSSGKAVSFDSAEIYANAQGSPYLYLSQLDLFASFSNAVSAQLSEILQEKEEDIFFRDKKIRSIDKIDFSGVAEKKNKS